MVADMHGERIIQLEKLQKIISYKFKDISLLNQALTHKSYVNENLKEDGGDNERLEFLGDSVLNMIISHILMELFPCYREGDLTKLRSTIVNEKGIAERSRQLSLGKFLLLGKGEENSRGRSKNSILANTYEALIAAIYLDGGYKKVFKVIQRHFNSVLAAVRQGTLKPGDYKSQLQECTQSIYKKTPLYSVVKEVGPDHDKSFEIHITLNNKVIGKGMGKNKKEAAQLAAQRALEKILKDSIL